MFVCESLPDRDRVSEAEKGRMCAFVRREEGVCV